MPSTVRKSAFALLRNGGPMGLPRDRWIVAKGRSRRSLLLRGGALPDIGKQLGMRPEAVIAG